MQETWVWSLGQEDPLEKGRAYSNILAWRISWTEEPGGLQSLGLQTVRHVLLSKQEAGFKCLAWSPSFSCSKKCKQVASCKCLIVTQLSPASGRGKVEIVSFDSCCCCSVAKWCPTLRLFAAWWTVESFDSKLNFCSTISEISLHRVEGEIFWLPPITCPVVYNLGKLLGGHWSFLWVHYGGKMRSRSWRAPGLAFGPYSVCGFACFTVGLLCKMFEDRVLQLKQG